MLADCLTKQLYGPEFVAARLALGVQKIQDWRWWSYARLKTQDSSSVFCMIDSFLCYFPSRKQSTLSFRLQGCVVWYCIHMHDGMFHKNILSWRDWLYMIERETRSDALYSRYLLLKRTDVELFSLGPVLHFCKTNLYSLSITHWVSTNPVRCLFSLRWVLHTTNLVVSYSFHGIAEFCILLASACFAAACCSFWCAVVLRRVPWRGCSASQTVKFTLTQIRS
jgi:hypothetical protein